jgi:hypothetical protein
MNANGISSSISSVHLSSEFNQPFPSLTESTRSFSIEEVSPSKSLIHIEPINSFINEENTTITNMENNNNISNNSTIDEFSVVAPTKAEVGVQYSDPVDLNERTLSLTMRNYNITIEEKEPSEPHVMLIDNNNNTNRSSTSEKLLNQLLLMAQEMRKPIDYSKRKSYQVLSPTIPSRNDIGQYRRHSYDIMNSCHSKTDFDKIRKTFEELSQKSHALIEPPTTAPNLTESRTDDFSCGLTSKIELYSSHSSNNIQNMSSESSPTSSNEDISSPEQPDNPTTPEEIPSITHQVTTQVDKIISESYEYCNMYDSITSDSSKKFSVDIVSLIFSSIITKVENVIEIVKPIMKVSELCSHINDMKYDFVQHDKSNHVKQGLLLRSFIQKLVSLLQSLVQEFIKASHILFARPSEKFGVEATGSVKTQSYETTLLDMLDDDCQTYRTYFLGQDHKVYAGVVDGTMILITLKKEDRSQSSVVVGGGALSKDGDFVHRSPSDEVAPDELIRIIVRRSNMSDNRFNLKVSEFQAAGYSNSSILHHHHQRKLSMKAVLAAKCPDIPFGKLKKLVPSEAIQSRIVAIDELRYNVNYKVGVIYCKEGQKTEEQYFSNGKILFFGLKL